MGGYRSMVEHHKSENACNDGEEDPTCPLCMEVLDETDRNFYPCTCDYQLCLWCLHYIRTTMGNKCPACRRDYDEATMKYKSNPRPQTTSRGVSSKKKRELGDKEATTREGRSSSPRNNINLKDVRVIQRNLVYVVGISSRVAKKEVLKQAEYFGQYGKIQHIVINKSQSYNSHTGAPSYTAYITYSKKSEAAAAIQGIDGSQVDGRVLRASYGTTKYCSYFFKGLKCTNPDCFYLHHFGDERERISRDDLTRLMHRASNPPFGVVDHGRDSSVTSKYKEDTSIKHQDHSSQDNVSNISHSKSPDSQGKDKPHGYNFHASNHDSSWANVAPTVKDDAAQGESMGYYAYQQPEELQLQYSVAGEGCSDGYGQAFDYYQQSRVEGDSVSKDRIVNNHISHVDVYTTKDGVTPDQYDVMQRLLSTPLLVDLQRYNQGEHIVYSVDLQSRQLRDHVDHLGQQGDGNMSDMIDGSSDYSQWLVAEEVQSSSALHVANRRRQIDYYKRMNQLTPCKEGESAMATHESSLAPRQLFTDPESVDYILHKIKRHSIMIENLAKHYQCDPQNRRTMAEHNDREYMDTSKSVSSNGDVMTGDSTAMEASPLLSVPKNGFHVSNILCSSTLGDLELDAEIKVHAELRAVVSKLLDVQLQREREFACHLSQLD